MNSQQATQFNSNTSSQVGYLEIILGPMFSSKTTYLLKTYNQYKFCNIPIIAINHSFDKRYHDSLMSTHDKVMIPCVQTDNLLELFKDVSYFDNDVFLINEGQFFQDLYEAVDLLLKHNKKIFVSGLDGDFERKKFGKILDLIPLCDKVTKLTSLCSICKDGTLGIFSMRLTNDKQQTLVGSDNYIPVCRMCYENKDKQINKNNN